MGKDETIIVCSAHSDDFVIGAGGTIANYIQKGKKVVVIIFSYGEKSHPWLKNEVVQKMRAQETFEAAKLLHCKCYFFDLKEFRFLEEYKGKEVDKKLKEIVQSNHPSKIFTHSNEDPHPDHKAVHQMTLEVVNILKEKPEVYVYSIWNPVSFKTKYPSLYVNVTKNFKLKLKALKTFRSQKVHITYPVLLLFFRAIKDGFKIGTFFGEHFFRIL